MNKFKAFTLLLLLLWLPFCSDDAPRQTVPFAPVNFQLDLNGLDHSLKNSLSFKIFTEQDRRTDNDRFGYSGVLVISGMGVTTDVTGTNFYAYDLCCPHEKNRKSTIIPEEDGTATCATCGSEFVTMYGLGTPQKGPATESLQRYRVIPTQYGTYRVVN